MIARLTLDRAHVELEGRQGYYIRFPICALPAWLAFYTKMRDRRGGKYAHHYAETVTSLAAVAADLERPAP